MSAPKNDKPEEPKTTTEAKPAAEAPAAAASESKDAKSDAKSWQEQLKKFAYAAVGSVNLSADDMKGVVTKLVEKGEIAKKDGEKLLKTFADKVQATVKRDAKAAKPGAEPAGEAAAAAPVAEADKPAAFALTQEKLAEKINGSIEKMLHSMNIATRKDVEELGKQLDELDKKFAQLVEAATVKGNARKPQPAPNLSTAS